MVWDRIADLVYYKHVEGDVLQSLKNLEIEMVKTDISVRCSKTIANALCITGTLAAPFTFGASLIATGAGIGIYVASTLGESALLSFYIEKAKDITAKRPFLEASFAILLILRWISVWHKLSMWYQ